MPLQSFTERLWCLSVVACAGIIGWTGCQSAPDEVSVTPWSPIVAIPLLDTRFDLSDVLEVVTDSLDSVPVETLSSGELAFYHEEFFRGTIAPEWLVLPGFLSSGEVVLEADDANVIDDLPPGQALGYEVEVSSELLIEEPEGARLDRVELSEGSLMFSVTNGTGEAVAINCVIPGLLNPNGFPYNVAITSGDLASGSFAVTQDISGWVLLLENGPDLTNGIQGLCSLEISNDPGNVAAAGEVSFDLELDGLEFNRVEGDFGMATITLEEESETLALFDDRFTTSGIGIERASLRLEVENGFGVEAILDSVDLASFAEGTPDVLFELEAPPFVVPSANDNFNAPSISVLEVNETNSNVVDFFSAEPRDIDLGMRIRCNPDGPVGPSGNFLDAEGYVSAKWRAEIPLSIRAEQVDFAETLDVDINIEEQTELDSAVLRLILHNGFPFEVGIRAVFLDADDVPLDSLSTDTLNLFTLPAIDGEGFPIEEGLFVHDFALDWERADQLRLAKRVMVQAWCETAEASSGQFVRLTEEQGLRMELGLLVYSTQDL